TPWPGMSPSPPARCRTRLPCRPSRGPSSSTPPSAASRGRRRSSTPAGSGSPRASSMASGTTTPSTSPRGSRAASSPMMVRSLRLCVRTRGSISTPSPAPTPSSTPAPSPRGSRERDEVRDLPGRRRDRPHRLAPAMARRAGRRLHELRVEGRDGVRLSDAITQALTQGQRVRYATVVGNTITGTQVSIGGEVVEVPYLGDDAPEVGKRAVLVASAGGLLCIGTTTPEEPEWQEPEAMVVRPEGGWHATRKYPWQGGEWRDSYYSTAYSSVTTRGLWAGIRRQDEFEGTTYLGPILDSEMAFALQYPVLPIPDGAELLDATLRLYSTYYYSVGTSGGEPFARRVPTKSRTVEVVMEAGAL